MVNGSTDYLCLLLDAEGKRPMGLKVPLKRLQPATAEESVTATVNRVLPLVRVR
jgi:hypothetical protein